MDLVIEPSQKITGKVTPSPSKLHTQFAIGMGLLADGKTTLNSPLDVDDTRDLIKAVEVLGATTKRGNKNWSIWGNGEHLKPTGQVLDGKKSIVNLSLLASVSALASRLMVITGENQVRRVPVSHLIDSLQQMGVDIHSTKDDETPPLVVFESDLRGGEVFVDGDTDPKFLPALLLLAPLVEEKVELSFDEKFKGHFLDAPLELLKSSGIDISGSGEKLKVSQGSPDPIQVTPPLDILSIFPYVTGSIITQSELEIGITDRTINVDIFTDLIDKIGVEFERGEEFIKISGGGDLSAGSIDLGDHPELLPFFALIACFAAGETRLENAERARRMKSDRIAATVEGFKKMGVEVSEHDDGVTIKGPAELEGGKINGRWDDVIVAAFGVAGLQAKGVTVVKNRAEALSQSYPHFVSDFKDLGAKMRYGRY